MVLADDFCRARFFRVDAGKEESFSAYYCGIAGSHIELLAGNLILTSNLKQKIC